MATLVSALLIGGNVLGRRGQDVGGDFQNIPACRSTDQTGCVVAYSSFNQPPPADSFFGRVGRRPDQGEQATAKLEVLCVNPASLSGGTGPLKPYFPTTPFPGRRSGSLHTLRTHAVGGLPRALHRPLRELRRRQLAAG